MGWDLPVRQILVATFSSVRSHRAIKDTAVLLCIRTPVTLIYELKPGLALQVRCIVGTELCERFSFYGLRSVLITFLTGQLGQQPSTAESVFHAFTAGCYLMPLAGAYIADRHLGRYRTILFFSLFYCLGHGTIAAFDTLAVRPGVSSCLGCYMACGIHMQATRTASKVHMHLLLHTCRVLDSGSCHTNDSCCAHAKHQASPMYGSAAW